MNINNEPCLYYEYLEDFVTNKTKIFICNIIIVMKLAILFLTIIYCPISILQNNFLFNSIYLRNIQINDFEQHPWFSPDCQMDSWHKKYLRTTDRVLTLPLTYEAR